MTIARGDGVALLRALVRVDSRNPSLATGAPGELPVARALSEVLRAWGFDVQVVDALPGRPNVVATLRGSGGGRSLMFNGHLDVVGVEGMTHAPFDALERNGRIYGRGASDMKGGVAAMCAAASRLHGAGGLRGDLVVAGVADEEWKSAGTAALIASGVRADAAIVTEPTRLAIMPAHKGFVWIEITFEGRAAHGSRWDLGVDAILNAGILLAELDRFDKEDLPRRTHALLGRPSLHAGTIEGGSGLSTYPDRCVVRIERRTIPGESAESVMRELDEALVRMAVSRIDQPTGARFSGSARIEFHQPPSDVPVNAPIVEAARSATRQCGIEPRIEGMSAWTDAALLNAAGIPAICFGPGDMGLAHAAEEYIESREIDRATDVLETLAREWCG